MSSTLLSDVVKACSVSTPSAMQKGFYRNAFSTMAISALYSQGYLRILAVRR